MDKTPVNVFSFLFQQLRCDLGSTWMEGLRAQGALDMPLPENFRKQVFVNLVNGAFNCWCR